VAATTLGSRALAFLKAHGLLLPLRPEELEAEWNAGRLESWYNRGGVPREAAYVRLIGALAELDSETPWEQAALRCLPAADKTWHSRRELKRYPPNWAILNPAPRVAAALEPFVGTPSGLLDWKTDQTLRRDAAAQRYVKTLDEPTLEKVVASWWASLGEELDPLTRELVIALTDLVRRQRTLPRLVSKVLAIGGGGEQLLPIDQVLLAEPYAGECRRVLFADLPTVSPVYLTSSEGATDADWRAFFEDQKPAPKGRPTLVLSRRAATDVDLRSLTAIPNLRVTDARSVWNGLSIDSSRHYVVDSHWPESAEPVAKNVSPAHALALQQWMLQSPGLFKTWCRTRVAYIARKSSDVSTVTLPTEAAWFVALKECPWLFDRNGGGPYRPGEVLCSPDASRPNAPVASLADGFPALANELGIVFGGAIPNAPAIDRLKVLGASASWPELRDLVRDAIAEAGQDTEQRALLQTVLTTAPLFELPAGKKTPDGKRRVPANRLVKGTRRSTLADWVCTVDSFPDLGLERRVLEDVSAVVPLPEATTAEHAAAFLCWVWNTEPDADTVRQVLPRAFQYVLALSEEAKSTLRTNAKVFVTSRRWLTVAGGNVYLNDLEISDKDLLDADNGVALATAGHLGDDEAAQVQVCAMLGLPLASSRYCIEVEERIGSAVTPESWNSGFRQAQEAFWRGLASAAEDGATRQATPAALDLVRVEAVIRRLVRDQVSLDEADLTVAILAGQADRQPGRAYVVGEPLAFAPDLAQALIEHWGITLRRDGYALGSRLTGLLASIDRAPAPSTADPPVRPPEVDPPPAPPEPDHPGDPDGGSDQTGPPKQPGDKPGKGTGKPTHTITRKDSQHEWLLKRQQELRQALRDVERQIAEGRGAEATLIEDEPPGSAPRKAFGNDKVYREAVLEYERRSGRFPEARDTDQPGFDVDSYTHDVGHPDRALVRRIEVKGKGVLWNGDEIVELSDRQLKDALARRVDFQEKLADGFDYWLYVVETEVSGHDVLPIRNPALKAAKFEFRGSVWRRLAEAGSSDGN
jgi:hypothetical protein